MEHKAEKSLYSSVLIKLPTPKFIVFYNGTKEQLDRQVLLLSDAYEKITKEVDLELKVTVYNVNYGRNAELLEACQTLKEYALYVERVRKYIKEMSLEEAVDRVIDECINKNILREFLIKYRAEVRDMCIFEYDEESEIQKIKKMEREDAFEEGKKAGEEILKMESKKKLINQVYKKILKGKSEEQAVDELEEELDVIKPIYEVIKAMDGGFDCDAVYEKLREK